jgi:Endonuclease/Exonuclease/phosphatase family
MRIIIFLCFFVSQLAQASWKVATFNVRNFESSNDAIEAVIGSVRSDVMAFEEIVNTANFKTLLKKILPAHAVTFSECGGRGEQHLALAYDPKVFDFVSEQEDAVCGSLRPVFQVKLRHKEENVDYTFAVVHLKAGGDARGMSTRAGQYKALSKLAKATKNMILLGDFNTTGFLPGDDDGERFRQFLTSSSHVTTSEEIGCTNYWGNPSNLEASILDHIVIPQELSGYASKIIVGSHCAKQRCQRSSAQKLGTTFQNVSDHCPVQLTLE